MADRRKLAWVTTAALAVGLANGCCSKKCDGIGAWHPEPIGALSDPIWKKMESNAEASDFVVHEHEFIANTARLNAAGEDHVKQIAARVAATPFPVLIQPSTMGVREGDKFGFAVHNDPALDMNRRQVIVAALLSLGVADAEQKVIISPALTPGFTSAEAESAYGVGISGGGGFGGGGGMGGGGGGVGFF